MSFLTLPFRLPLLPVQCVMKLAEVIRDEAERQYYSTSSVRDQLERIEQELRAGRLSADEAAALQQEAVGRLVRGSPGAG
jgi:hypothetical protein